MEQNIKYIHLLYVPTMECNMACKYCYLEDNTNDEFKKMKPLDTLEYAINKFKEQNVIPFNISLHGGEVTTLSHSDFYALIKFINDYYERYSGIYLKTKKFIEKYTDFEDVDLDLYEKRGRTNHLADTGRAANVESDLFDLNPLS